MLEGAIDAAFTVLLVVGLPALFAFFVLKGAIVGKPLPTVVFLPGYVIAISASPQQTVGIVFTSTLGYVCGQLLVYGGARRSGRSFIQSAPRVHISDARLDDAETWFKKYGGIGIFVTNFVPYLRGLILIPAGTAGYPLPWVIVAAFSSTIVYHTAVVVVVVGGVRLVF